MQQKALITVRNVSKTYRRGHEIITALRTVSLDIYSGEIMAIMGPSGSGKTTLSQIIGGLLNPTKGSVAINDMLLKLRSDKVMSRYRNQKVGFILQNFGLIPYYSALENVVSPLVISGIKPSERHRRAESLLKSVGLNEQLNQRVDQLSGGERQRVAIARALIGSPEIIIADEPTGNLDSKRGGEIMNLLEDLSKKEGVTVIVVTHDPALAKRADRIVYIRDGQIEKEAYART